MSERGGSPDPVRAASSTPVWSVGVPALALPPLEGVVEADACVVGLGGSGLSCIGELQRLGARVVGIDAVAVGGGAAGRNGGFLLAGIASFHHEASDSHGRERATRAWRLTLAELERIAAETPAAVRRTGTLRIAVDDEEMADCEAQLAEMTLDGLPVERYDGGGGGGHCSSRTTRASSRCCGAASCRGGRSPPAHGCTSTPRRSRSAGVR